MVGCDISPLFFLLLIEIVLSSAKANTNEITGQSMNALMDDAILVEQSRSYKEKLVTRRQKLFKCAVMKIKPSTSHSLSMIKGNSREI